MTRHVLFEVERSHPLFLEHQCTFVWFVFHAFFVESRRSFGRRWRGGTDKRGGTEKRRCRRRKSWTKCVLSSHQLIHLEGVTGTILTRLIVCISGRRKAAAKTTETKAEKESDPYLEDNNADVTIVAEAKTGHQMQDEILKEWDKIAQREAEGPFFHADIAWFGCLTIHIHGIVVLCSGSKHICPNFTCQVRKGNGSECVEWKR